MCTYRCLIYLILSASLQFVCSSIEDTHGQLTFDQDGPWLLRPHTLPWPDPDVSPEQPMLLYVAHLVHHQQPTHQSVIEW